MQEFEDTTKAVGGTKTARMEQRTKPHVKERIQEAAALLGVDEGTFVMSSAYARAQETIEEHRRSVLTDQDCAVFTAALERDARATETLTKLAEEHSQVVRQGA
ncbi:MAG: DUF1778 domain-containing protein [Myxococcota bacterium]